MKLTKNGLRAYYVEADGMGCGIRWYRNLKNATKRFTQESGSFNEPRVRRATQTDIDWVAAMGGKVDA